MADEYIYSNVPVHVRHLPDHSTETDANGINHQVELPGFIEIGVEIDGVFKPLSRIKAAGLLSDIKRAKQKQQQPPTNG